MRPPLVEAMLEPGFYPHEPGAVELRETHISWVFLAGELAYKVKKPLVLPFLDYGTAARRREMCREEVRLNARLAPRIYLRVAGIADSDGRYRLTAEEDPEASEYAVEMRRVDEDRSLAALAAADARELLDLGRRFAWRTRQPLLLIVAGVAGSGKTTLARRLAELSGWKRVSSDLTRKRLAGVAPTERAEDARYSAEMTARTYAELGRAAAEELRARGAAIVDATFHRRAERAAFEDGLGNPEAPRLLVECRASPELLFARVRGRAREPDRVSDAGPKVLRRQLAAVEPFTELPASRRLPLDTEPPVEALASAVEAFADRATL